MLAALHLCSLVSGFQVDNFRGWNSLRHGGIEAEGLAIEVELSVKGLSDGRRASEAVLFALEEDQSCCEAFVLQLLVDVCSLIHRHDLVLSSLQQYERVLNAQNVGKIIQLPL